MTNLLVVGARPGSIGDHVKYAAKEAGINVCTAGISGEDYRLELRYPGMSTAQERIKGVFNDRLYPPFHHVVCTVGVNMEGVPCGGNGLINRMHESFEVNVLAPMAVLEWWLTYWQSRPQDTVLGSKGPLHFVALSSNSAGVVRSTGMPYNASKAALSMAVRCAARHWARIDPRVSIYAYEPGWVAGTPMSNEIEQRLDEGIPFTRTPGERMLAPQDLARMIVANLGNDMMNGCCIRIDGGEA